jgi:hypothetical protein
MSPHGAGYEHLPGTGQRGDPRADVDDDTAELVTHHLALARVSSGSDVQADAAHLALPARRGAGRERGGAGRDRARRGATGTRPSRSARSATVSA